MQIKHGQTRVGNLVVLLGQVKQWIAYESQHQHAAIDRHDRWLQISFILTPGERTDLTNVFQGCNHHLAS